MAFNSVVFLLFFALVLLVNGMAIGWRAKKLNLLLLSYVFYAAWNPPFVALLWISTLTDWVAARRIASSQGMARRGWLLVSLVVNLGLLGYFKYANFLAETSSSLLAWWGWSAGWEPVDIILPLGISFYTFQSMSYSIDVYRKRLSGNDSLLDFSLYVSFFPQLVAGPILRAGFFLDQLAERAERRSAELGWGMAFISLGMFEKVVLADGILAPVVERVYAATIQPGFVDAWIGTLAFSGQIFFDFNGYSVIAVGLARCLGFDLPWNFRSPYAAVGFSDFWRRWHITLSQWLRDYLYIPLSGNRAGAFRTLVNLMLTMLLGGLWHGASWLFVAWGALHGLFLVAERLLRRGLGRLAPVRVALAQPAVALLTFLAVTLSWVLFRAENFASAKQILSAMSQPGSTSSVVSATDVALVLSLLAALLVTHYWLRARDFQATIARTP